MTLRRLYSGTNRGRLAETCVDEHCDGVIGVFGDCLECGLSNIKVNVFMVFTTDKYHGVDKMSSHTATLIIDGDDYASVHVDRDLSDAGGDVAWLHLGYISKDKQTDEIASIIADFAKWVRYEWVNADKQNDLPTLVRLLGFYEDKSKPMGIGKGLRLERFVALPDASKIKAEHLAREFTSIEVTPATA